MWKKKGKEFWGPETSAGCLLVRPACKRAWTPGQASAGISDCNASTHAHTHATYAAAMKGQLEERCRAADSHQGAEGSHVQPKVLQRQEKGEGRRRGA